VRHNLARFFHTALNSSTHIDGNGTHYTSREEITKTPTGPDNLESPLANWTVLYQITLALRIEYTYNYLTGQVQRILRVHHGPLLGKTCLQAKAL
jgi:hypothetical protein